MTDRMVMHDSRRFHMSEMHRYSRVLIAAMLFLPLSAALLDAENSTEAALRVTAILEQNCANAGCHGGADAYHFDVRNPSTLLDAKVIQPGNAGGSEMIRRLEAGLMPLGGYKGQPGVKLPETDIQELKRWIDAGAPLPPRPSIVARPFIPESQILAAIIRDLKVAPKADRLFLRYFSMANLSNAADVSANELPMYRSALSKLVNHLSWQKEVAEPSEIDEDATLLRIDLRKYRWTA